MASAKLVSLFLVAVCLAAASRPVHGEPSARLLQSGLPWPCSPQCTVALSCICMASAPERLSHWLVCLVESCCMADRWHCTWLSCRAKHGDAIVQQLFCSIHEVVFAISTCILQVCNWRTCNRTICIQHVELHAQCSLKLAHMILCFYRSGMLRRCLQCGKCM